MNEPSYTARFVPQAWIGDQALDIDPAGDTEWDATGAVAALDADYRTDLLAELEGEFEVLDLLDQLKGDPNAPGWVREHSGPFSIWIRVTRDNTTQERLEYLRQQLRTGTMSYGELAELQDLASQIDPGDVELLEAAGVPESQHGDHTDEQYIAITVMARYDGRDRAAIERAIEVALGCTDPDEPEGVCPVVECSSTVGTFDQATRWLHDDGDAEPVSGGALRAALAAVRVNGFGDHVDDDSIIEQAAQAALDGAVLTRDQLEAWAGHPLTDDQVERLDECIPNSSIPEAIATIVSEALGGDTTEVSE